MTDPRSLVERAREAAAQRAWEPAYALLSEAAAAGDLAPTDRPFFAEVAYAAGHLDVTIEAWERMHAESVKAGDDLAAAGAAVRVAMHLLFDTAFMAPVRGWLSRAERMLGGPDRAASGSSPVHAWLSVVRNYERMLSGDAEGARVWARRAIEIGSIHDRAAAAIGRVAEARSLILVGEVKDGLAMLEEAGVAVVSGEIDPLSTGVVYCELLCALQGLAQIDLAEEWTRAMEHWSNRNAIGSLRGRCRVHRAEILRFRGAFDRAEEELRVACDELRPYVHRELGWPLYELGRVRLRKGDVDGAEEALLDAHGLGWNAQPGLALVELARGDHARAAASIRDALAKPSFVPSKELPPDTDLWRFPLLEAQTEIGAAMGGDELASARSASDELTRIAGRFGSKALEASASVARGRVLLAGGNPHEAERCLEAGARAWNDIGAPYEAARARVVLADARRCMGNAAGADLELRAATAIFERLGVRGKNTSVPPMAVTATPPRSSGGTFLREGDTWGLTFDERTIRVRDRKGMHYLATLLEEPRRERHVLDLASASTSSTHDSGDAGPLLDAKAKEAYRRRLVETEQDLAEAERDGDLGRAARSRDEREILARELARAFGAGGRARPGPGSAAERARVAVTRAIRQAIVAIGEYHPALAAHLENSIKTGTFCSYALDPQSGIRWTVARE